MINKIVCICPIYQKNSLAHDCLPLFHIFGGWGRGLINHYYHHFKIIFNISRCLNVMMSTQIIYLTHLHSKFSLWIPRLVYISTTKQMIATIHTFKQKHFSPICITHCDLKIILHVGQNIMIK